MTGTVQCSWFANWHVFCLTEGTSAVGTYAEMRTVTYRPDLKQYAAYVVDNSGDTLLALGQVSGDTWTFTSDEEGTKTRVVTKMGPDSYIMTSEYPGPDGKWVETLVIKATRQK